MAEFGVVTQVGRSIFLGVRHVHIPGGRGASVIKIFGTHTYAKTV